MHEVSGQTESQRPWRRAEAERWIRWIYEGLMAALALAVVWLLTLPDQGWVRTANLAIWAIFVVDYGVRITLAKNRWQFVRQNIPDLIAIMPLDFLRVARLARLARLIRLLRVGVVLWRVTRDVRGVLGTNGLAYVLLFTVSLVAIGGMVIWIVEPSIVTLMDGIWWSIVTATTVGYGDISPETTWGRVIAVVLMVIGIGTLGMITGSIATYFIGGSSRPVNPHIQHIQDALGRWAEMSGAERRQVAAMLTGLASEDIAVGQERGKQEQPTECQR